MYQVRTLPEQACEWCGRSWTPRRPNSHRRRLGLLPRFCSARCANQSRSEGKSSPLVLASCLECRSIYVHRFRHHCGFRYRKIAGSLVKRTCGACGVPLTIVSRQGRYRCVDCKRAVDRLHRRTAKAIRRARRRGAVSEPFTASEIFERDRYRCGLCRKQVSRTRLVPHPMAATLDHIVPLAAGGDHVRANVQCAHFICNSRKGQGTAPSGDQLRLVG